MPLSRAKRFFDVAAAAGGLLLLSPVLLLAALAVKLSSPGPVFYRDRRSGLGGQVFFLLKFRSMEDGAAMKGAGITVGGDPRVTRVGRWLRQWKVDELPNLINVLRGEMSIVGPRPERPEYVALYTPEQRRVLEVRPGITSTAAAGAYRDEEALLASAPDPLRMYIDVVMPEKLRLDAAYVAAGPGLWSDLRIVLRTLSAIARPNP